MSVISMFFGGGREASRKVGEAVAQLQEADDLKKLGRAHESRVHLAAAAELCQQAISSERQAGDAYVMLASATLAAADIPDTSDEARSRLAGYTAGAISHLSQLPYLRYPFIRNRDAIDVVQAQLAKLNSSSTSSGTPSLAQVSYTPQDYANMAVSRAAFSVLQQLIAGDDSASIAA